MRRIWLALAGLTIGLLLLSLAVGAEPLGLSEVWQGLTRPDGGLASVIVRELRLPRGLVALLVGANLAVAGALLQGVTRNPLTSPSVIGINGGASFVLATVTALIPGFPLRWLPFIALVGAALGATVVFSLVGRGITPVRLALAGVATAALLGSLTTGILVTFEQHATIYLWLSGTLAARTWSHLANLLPWSAIALPLALLLSPRVNLLALGDDLATGLGLGVGRLRIFLGALVVILAGSAVSVAGPISFVGLMVPHMGRRLVGTDYRRLLPVCLALGGLLLLSADLTARVIIRPEEAPVGAVTAALGAPFFLYLARRERV